MLFVGWGCGKQFGIHRHILHAGQIRRGGSDDHVLPVFVGGQVIRLAINHLLQPGIRLASVQLFQLVDDELLITGSHVPAQVLGADLEHGFFPFAVPSAVPHAMLERNKLRGLVNGLQTQIERPRGHVLVDDHQPQGWHFERVGGQLSGNCQAYERILQHSIHRCLGANPASVDHLPRGEFAVRFDGIPVDAAQGIRADQIRLISHADARYGAEKGLSNRIS